MKRLLFLAPLIFLGCSVSNTTTKVTEFTKCYVHQLPAPFWVCYQSSFLSVGKVHADKLNRLKQEEAYSLGVSELVAKLQSKTKLFLRKLGLEDKNIDSEIKDFVILNALQGDSWYSKDEKMIYVQVKIDKEEFKKFLFDKCKKIDKKVLENTFDETF
ncbi:putative lipoprotein [Nautilia profundicola AmH]|uniref:Lipoprotein n=1 Tax=Nautilia profundicola (strain ATCC BAA-1463 / DSM 18972 / AmH) TaxID=598659 RepID=B9L7M3_NAUPA|nr:hypothetical protein [Nautilia profundicola]ACM93086.1 putative lipoprotein [Nautilia profundicola AmH]